MHAFQYSTHIIKIHVPPSICTHASLYLGVYFKSAEPDRQASRSATAPVKGLVGMEGEKKAAAVAEDEVVVVAAGDVSLKDLSKKLNDFARERDWEQFHSPRNLLLAMVCILLLSSALYYSRSKSSPVCCPSIDFVVFHLHTHYMFESSRIKTLEQSRVFYVSVTRLPLPPAPFNFGVDIVVFLR